MLINRFVALPAIQATALPSDVLKKYEKGNQTLPRITCRVFPKLQSNKIKIKIGLEPRVK